MEPETPAITVEQNLCPECGHRIWHCYDITGDPYWKHFANPPGVDTFNPDTGPCWCGCEVRRMVPKSMKGDGWRI